MSSIITAKYRIQNAARFKADFDNADTTKNVYFFVGKPNPWDVDTDPDDTVDSIEENNKCRFDLLALKKVVESSVSHVVPRADWDTTELTKYVPYSHEDVDLFNHPTSAEIVASAGSPIALANNPFATVNTTATVTVTHTSHGFSTSDSLIITGAANTNGILAANLNGTRVITVVNANSYTFTAGGNATSTGSGGGAAVFVTDEETQYTAGTFYTVTDEFNVYKCLDNNDAKSTEKPTGRSTSVIETADGYKWKYMYTILASEVLKYMTTEWIPVKVLDEDDGSNQWLVQEAAVDGAIDIINVTNQGSGYSNKFGVDSSGDNDGSLLTSNGGGANTFELSVSGSAVDDAYTGATIYIISGAGAGQKRLISDYVGATKIGTVSSNWTVAVNGTSVIEILPTITITGDGSGAEAKATIANTNKVTKITMTSGAPVILGSAPFATVNTTATVTVTHATHGYTSGANLIISGAVDTNGIAAANLNGTREITVVNANSYTFTAGGNATSTGTGGGTVVYVAPSSARGTGYHAATVTITGCGGTGAAATPIIGVPNGHGSNAVNELGGLFLMVNAKLDPAEIDFPLTNDYRQCGLITNVTNYGTDTISTATTLSATKSFTVSTVTGTFVQDEDLVSNGSGAPTAIFEEFVDLGSGTGTIHYIQNSESGFETFATSQVLTGGTSGATAVITAINNPEVAPFSGEIVYTENRRPIMRASGQVEDFKVVIES